MFKHLDNNICYFLQFWAVLPMISSGFTREIAFSRWVGGQVVSGRSEGTLGLTLQSPGLLHHTVALALQESKLQCVSTFLAFASIITLVDVPLAKAKVTCQGQR